MAPAYIAAALVGWWVFALWWPCQGAGFYVTYKIWLKR